jgi:hypothetical protein
VLDVDLEGAAADHQVLGDLGVRLALAEEGEDLDLPGREGLYPVRLAFAPAPPASLAASGARTPWSDPAPPKPASSPTPCEPPSRVSPSSRSLASLTKSLIASSWFNGEFPSKGDCEVMVGCLRVEQI